MQHCDLFWQIGQFQDWFRMEFVSFPWWTSITNCNFVIFYNFLKTNLLYSCFGLLVTSILSFKPCFITCVQWIPQIQLWGDTCWTLEGQHGSWAIFWSTYLHSSIQALVVLELGSSVWHSVCRRDTESAMSANLCDILYFMKKAESTGAPQDIPKAFHNSSNYNIYLKKVGLTRSLLKIL